MLVRPNGRFVTQRELPRMALIDTQLSATTLTLDRAGHAAARSAARCRRRDARGNGVEIRRPRHRLRRRRRGVVSQYLETPLRLVRFDASAPRVCSPEWTPGTRAVTEFSDGYPILVISRASLADLNSRLPKALPMERFRPNIVIDGVDAYDEDRIHELRAGPVTLAPREALHALLDHHHRSAAGAKWMASSRCGRSRSIATTRSCAA